MLMIKLIISFHKSRKQTMNLHGNLYDAVRAGKIGAVKNISDHLENIDWDIHLCNAGFFGYPEIIDYAMAEGASDLSGCIKCAALGKRYNVIKHIENLIAKGKIEELDWNECIEEAVEIGDIKLVKHIISNQDYEHEWYIERAARYGHFKIVDYLGSCVMNLDTWERVMGEAAENGHYTIVIYAELKGAVNFEECGFLALHNCHYDIAGYLGNKVF